MRMAEMGGERFAATAAAGGLNDQRGVAGSTRPGQRQTRPVACSPALRWPRAKPKPAHDLACILSVPRPLRITPGRAANRFRRYRRHPIRSHEITFCITTGYAAPLFFHWSLLPAGDYARNRIARGAYERKHHDGRSGIPTFRCCPRCGEARKVDGGCTGRFTKVECTSE